MKNLSRDLTPIQRLWNRHYIHDETNTFHGDVGCAWRRMLADPDCDADTAAKIRQAVAVHRRINNTDLIQHFERTT